MIQILLTLFSKINIKTLKVEYLNVKQILNVKEKYFSLYFNKQL